MSVNMHGMHRTCFRIHWILQIEGDVDDGPYHLVSVSLRGVLQTFLNNVGCELVLGEVQEIGLHLPDEHSSVSLPSVLHHELNDVVAVAVL